MKALILEDNLNLLKQLENSLTDKKWEVYTSSSWKEAKVLIEKHSFFLLILDILLPDKKGFEVLDFLANNKVNKPSHICIISGLVDKQTVIKNIPTVFKNNFTFLKKPIEDKLWEKFLEKAKNEPSGKKESNGLDFFFEKGMPSKNINFYLPKIKTFHSKELIYSIWLAYLKRFNGQFTITTDKQTQGVIHFHKGHIIKMISNSNTSFFGALLVEHGLSLKEDIEDTLEDTQLERPIGERLVAKKLLSPHMLYFMLKEQLKIRLSEIMSHSSFTLDIMEKPHEQKESVDMDFNESDMIEWLADCSQTELKPEFINDFYLKIQSSLIEKSSQINNFTATQKNFLQNYNLLFKSIENGELVQDIVRSSQNKQETLKQLYFGLLTKSIYLVNETKEKIKIQEVNALIYSILEKDPKDLFSILHLPWNSAPTEIEQSYKQLIQKIHPDALPKDISPELKKKIEKAFHKVTKSYQILKNTDKRQEYIKKQKEKDFTFILEKYNEGITNIKQGQFKEGLKKLLPIKDHSQAPSNTILYILWAKIKSQPKLLIKNRELATEIKKSLDTCPISIRTSALFWYIKGLFCAGTNQYERAINLFQKSLALQKNFVEAKRELVLINQRIKIARKRRKKKKNLMNILLRKTG